MRSLVYFQLSSGSTRIVRSILDMRSECRFLDTEVVGSNLGICILCHSARNFIYNASVHSAAKCVPMWGQPREGCSVR